MTTHRHSIPAVVALLLWSGVASAQEKSAWDTFTILEMKIGMPIDGNAGFACGKPRTSEPEDRHCVKFTDPRCAGKPGNVSFKLSSEKAPMGCFLDYSNSATYLDDTLMQTPNTNDSSDKRPKRLPLQNLHLTGTQSKPSKIYRMTYMVALDDLAEDSKLYQALVAKYGEPTEKRPPNQMRWALDNTRVKATCSNQNCELMVEDTKFEENERRLQEEADAKKRRKNAPEAPKL